MTDSSNSQDVFLRNRIRRQLVPLLKEGFNPQVEANLARTAEIMRLDEDYMKGTVAEFLKLWGLAHGDEERKIPLPEFLKLHEALQRRIIKTLLAGMSDSGQGVGYRHVKAAVALAQGRQGCGSLDLPGNVMLRLEYDRMIFSRRTRGFENLPARALPASAAPATLPFLYPAAIPGLVEVKEAGITLDFRMVEKKSLSRLSGKGRMVFMDYEKVRLPLAVRNAKPGDRFQPLGMEGTKKLKSFLIDEKVPRRHRQVIPLLVDRETVLWIAGMRMSERIRVTGETRLVLKVEIV
jgi:tRNA(Ile)-lysidine synthase